ncbi:MAG: single-stranded-DNA-specific exonuclease RecJ [Ignavibacteria bacterium]|nr:single-stranded-DNA-specific exonuclease RecJ [Ignavibacteria bacterium]MBT8382411.1 single-stranded-DNA-specific exonuclease RecJ [Ignavibacteria bacterium]MBT8390782.1 single-stranded-DNA-specific exonuclease RecJ [Ignavibacteria bacterium]NNJ51997.1 single-stranded-DNA-specific exonuclease RecJ [Ignavibacteriaceae bacterium]NNL20154.1 single-stranded-DNA-specific exonuclease RecJ [Ignavibacteriaceae bacterium]
MVQNRWILKEVKDEFPVQVLADSLNISEILAKLLVIRNISNFNEARQFFRPSLEFLHDPFLMDQMEQATTRVIEALTENHKICIYGDYDVDGTCSTALLYMFLKELGANVEFYIPKRLEEGYGLSTSAIDVVHSKGTVLMITVDCGITAIEETEYAESLGLDVIICDHHQPKDDLPSAVAVLDPLKPGCNYPFKYLSGAGVAFKLAQGVCERIGKRDLPLKYLDLVALAGAADIVPLVDENRILVNEGLNQINNNPRPAIEALIDSSRLQPGQLNSGQVVFTIAPRINAVGRLGDAERAVNLLITKNKSEAIDLAQILETENYERRKIDVDTFDEACKQVQGTIDLHKELSIVLHNENWHPGVIGIVASRLVEKFYRPSVLLATIDGVAKGSARSISNFNIYEALGKCEEHLIHFGGHQAAAGLAMEVDKVKDFRKAFNKVVQETINEEDLFPELAIDAKIKFSDITPKFFRILEQFAPFGPGNLRPVFLAENVEVSNTPRIVGKNHLLLCLKQRGSKKIFDCIGFNMGNNYEMIIENNSGIDIVFSIDRTVRDTRVFPQFKLKDIKFNDIDEESK